MTLKFFGRRLGAAHLAAFATFILALALRAHWFHVTERSPDEDLYTKFGAGIAREGPAWQARLTRQFNAGEDVDYPWPNRFGFMALVAVAMRVTGHRTVETGELLSTASSLGAIGLIGAIGFLALDPWAGVIAMLFLAASPLDLGLARRAWQDDVMSLLSVGMVACFLVAANGDRRTRLASLGFMAIACFALTVKESSIIPVGLGVAGLAFIEWRRTGGWRAPVGVLALGATAGLLAAAVIVAANGGWKALHATWLLSKEATAPDDYMREYQSGGIGYYLTGFRILQPVPFMLGYLAAIWALLRARWPLARLDAPRAGAALAALAIYAIAFSAVSFSYPSKNLRFLSPIYGPIALLAGSLVVAGVRAIPVARPARARAIAIAFAAVLLLASAARDIACFRHYFIEYQIQDLATPWFTQVDKGKL
ncbi:MAG TPA: hypothetical protein VMJ70_02295 [Candidatus Sulfotelmatobacter sp.]|nr:hypothetical protein [Candidatus Sulfotelmatobacter sp.]